MSGASPETLRGQNEVHALKRLASIPASLLQRTTCSTRPARMPRIMRDSIELKYAEHPCQSEGVRRVR